MGEVLGGVIAAAAFMLTGAILWEIYVSEPRRARSERQARELLAECLEFIKRRGTYFYTNERRGPGSRLVDRIEKEIGRG